MITYDNDTFSCGICKGRAVASDMCRFYFHDNQTRMVGVEIHNVSEIIGVYKEFGMDRSIISPIGYFLLGAAVVDAMYQTFQDHYHEAARLFGKEHL